MRLIDFCRPTTTSRHPADCSILPCGRRTRLTPRRSLRSSPSSFTAISPASRAERESSAPPFALRFPGRATRIGEMSRGSVMDNSLPRLPFGGRRLTRRGLLSPVAFRRRCLWHPRRALARRRTCAPRTARFRRSVKSVGRCRPQVPSLNRVRRFLRPLSRPISAAPATPFLWTTTFAEAVAGASSSIRRSC